MSFVTTIDLSLAEQLRRDLIEQGFTLSTPPHTIFAAKKSGVSCTLYLSGKLVVQGKEMDSFIEFYLEPHILKEFTYTHTSTPSEELDTIARIGIDESGKGDFFGPLCIAGVFAAGDAILKLKEAGVRDSKELSDAAIYKIAKEIQQIVTCHVVRIGPAKYNEIYPKFGNLNSLLAWGHATAIEQLVEQTGCQKVVIDQFASSKSVVLNALKRKGLSIDLTQRHGAEGDLVVAAASILARRGFLEGLKKLEEEYGVTLPKGASSQTVRAGKDFVRQHGKEMLRHVAKLHFKTLEKILPSSDNP